MLTWKCQSSKKTSMCNLYSIGAFYESTAAKEWFNFDKNDKNVKFRASSTKFAHSCLRVEFFRYNPCKTKQIRCDGGKVQISATQRMIVQYSKAMTSSLRKQKNKETKSMMDVEREKNWHDDGLFHMFVTMFNVIFSKFERQLFSKNINWTHRKLRTFILFHRMKTNERNKKNKTRQWC